jgi:hypothetical protein
LKVLLVYASEIGLPKSDTSLLKKAAVLPINGMCPIGNIDPLAYPLFHLKYLLFR